MAGIYGVLLKNNHQKDICNNFYNSKFKNTIQEEVVFNDFRFGRSVLNKFQQDRFFYEDENYLICFEGVNYGKIRKPAEFITAFETKGKTFISDLKGIFSGFILSKKNKKIHVFNDPLATKAIYYYVSDEGFVFSSEMHVLSKLLRQNKINISYDFDGIYSLALFGQMFNNFTLVKEIKRLSYASIISYDLKSKELEIHQYYKFKKNIIPQELPEVIERLNTEVERTIDEIWKKDTENGYKEHLSLISGGMDSRTNAMIAKKLGFNKINGYTYGNADSSDVKIASEIAKDNFYSHMQFNLHNGNFFTENILENYIKPIDGLTHFTASAIIFNAFSRLNMEDYGQIHSGQIGGMITGGNVYPNFDFQNNQGKLGLNGFVTHKEMLKNLSFLDDLIDRYKGSDFEIFSFEQRLVNGTLTGDKIVSNFVDQAAIAFDLELLNYVLTIPTKYKINQRIYYKWLHAKHPKILEYKWENIGLKPNSDFKINYGRYIKKYVNGGKKYFGLKYDSMNPITNWFQANPSILKKFDQIFKENIHLIKDQELQKDLTKIYKDDIFEYRNKFAVITVVLAIKLHFES